MLAQDSRCILFGSHTVLKELNYLPTFINGNILHKNLDIWLLLENRNIWSFSICIPV